MDDGREFLRRERLHTGTSNGTFGVRRTTNSRDTWRTDSELRTGNATSLKPLDTADRHPEIARRDHTPKGFCGGRFFGTDLRESRDDRCALVLQLYIQHPGGSRAVQATESGPICMAFRPGPLHFAKP